MGGGFEVVGRTRLRHIRGMHSVRGHNGSCDSSHSTRRLNSQVLAAPGHDYMKGNMENPE